MGVNCYLAVSATCSFISMDIFDAKVLYYFVLICTCCTIHMLSVMDCHSQGHVHVPRGYKLTWSYMTFECMNRFHV